jgi:Ca2+/Na+ antiporter
MSSVFISPDSLPQDNYGLGQVIFLGAVYGFILFNASNMISDGSELLLLIPSLAGIVGSVVLPVLGAVPDGAIVLFSGMGPDAQEQLSVGVGALAGSTIMLLTIPWALAVFAGRVNLDSEGRGSYVRPRGVTNWSKLYPAGNANLLRTGIVLFDEISTNGKTMILTSLTYLVLQIPAFEYTGTIGRDAIAINSEVAAQEKPYALVAFVLSSIAFLGYLYWNIKRSSSSKVVADAIDEVRVAKIRSGEISLSGVLAKELAEMRKTAASENTPLNVQAQLQRVEDLIRPFFHVYDKNKDNQMNAEELQLFFKDMGESMTRAELQKWIDNADKNKNGFIEFQELVEPTLKYLIAKFEAERHGRIVEMKKIHVEVPHMDLTAKPNSDDDEEEDETVPEDLAHLSIAEQQRRILVRACYMMFVGTAVVLLFSDPMVDVLADVGKRTGIPSFYISFIFAPLASNASELIAAYNYALKKTSKSISISVSALLGAACMNNTLCLGIFAGLLYFKGGLIWKFSAETISILAVEFIMGWFAMRKTQRLLDALLVLLIYPLSIALVYVLENVFDLD